MKQCCNTCLYNVNGRCTVLPGEWNNIIPANIIDSYRCKEYMGDSNSNKKLVENREER